LPAAPFHAAPSAIVPAARPIRAVLFDLDGTLADTAPDLADALNRLRAEHGRTALPYARVRAEASHGAGALVQLGFGLEPDEPQFETLRQRFLALYAASVCRYSRLFPGMDPVLDALERTGRPWGIVTNKPARLTDPLVASLGIAQRACCVVSGDTTAQRKPHPEPLWHACRLAGIEPGECVYVGDAERDIQAGREAGVHTLAAVFGYLRNDDRPERWGADALVRAPGDILRWIDGTA